MRIHAERDNDQHRNDSNGKTEPKTKTNSTSKKIYWSNLDFLWFVNPDCKKFDLTEKVISLDAFLTVGFIPFFV